MPESERVAAHAAERPPPPWHASAPAAVADTLGTHARLGLSAAEAAARLGRQGPNLLRRRPPPPRWRAFARQFRELLTLILLAAAVLSAAVGDVTDAAVIVAIVLVNAVVGFLQEDRATRALEALERLAAPRALVVRDGGRLALPAERLVPGDLIVLEQGDAVPADARLVTAAALEVQEAALTGESQSVAKEAAAVLAPTTPLAGRATMVHAGTVVASGHATALVVATGMATELGRIATLLERGGPETTPLQRRLAALGRTLVVVCLAVVTLIGGLELARGAPLAEVFLRAVSLAVAAVPEGLPAVVTLVLAAGLQRLAAQNALVRRLPSVETLGSVTVICTDKTGTLTRGEMTVRSVVTATERLRVTGAGYAPRGEFLRESGGPPVAVGTLPDVARLLGIALRCNKATVAPDAAGAWRALGDPTEAALVVAALKGGVEAGDREAMVHLEIPFDATRRMMSVVVAAPGGRACLESKGATEAILPRCTAEARGGASSRSPPSGGGRSSPMPRRSRRGRCACCRWPIGISTKAPSRCRGARRRSGIWCTSASWGSSTPPARRHATRWRGAARRGSCR